MVEPYIATVRATDVRVGAVVSVPVWERGSVVRWQDAHVIETRNATNVPPWTPTNVEPTFIVTFDDGTPDALYFPYSLGMPSNVG